MYLRINYKIPLQKNDYAPPQMTDVTLLVLRSNNETI